MINIYVATKVRGFFVNLFNSSIEGVEFIWNKGKTYEINSKLKLRVAKIVKSKLGNYLGVIQRVNVKNNNFDIAFSYNRFLKVDKNYIICLENPTALFHYCLGRNETILGKKRIQKYLNDKNLKTIVCISKACYKTIGNFYNIPSSVKVEQIYPLIPKNPKTTMKAIEEKSNRKELRCLYISSDFKLKGGKDILECFKMLNIEGIDNIHLTIITRLSTLDDKLLFEINNMKNIEIFDFTFNKEQLNEIYNNSNILLNPTRQDSFSLVVLEAIKSGNVIISSDLYAIPEMVIDDYNGYLVGPKYRFFDYDNMPNKQVWNNRKDTIYSDYFDKNIIKFLFEKISYLNNNRRKLYELALNSWTKSNEGELSDEYIKNKWKQLIESI